MTTDDLTVASWFSGGGGLDIGLERAGWSVVSHSEIDPYACALLAQHWPGVPNLGDVSGLVDQDPSAGSERRGDHGRWHDAHVEHLGHAGGGSWPTATLWAGGPPCQDFSVAGKRAGLAGARSGLATVWFDLVGRHRPRALLFENVPGILSSRHGLDWHALLRQVGDLGYWWAYRVLDAQWFGVPQRRRRVWLLALDADRHPDPDGPAEVLAVGTRCGRDHAAEREAWAASAGRTGRGAGIVDQAISAKWSKRSSGPAGDEHHHLVVDRAASDPGGVREAPGLAGRLDDRPGMEGPRCAVMVAPTQNSNRTGGWRMDPDQAEGLVIGGPKAEDPLLPLGLDSHRYRVIGNGVAAPQSEWIGRRLAAYLGGSL